MAHDDISKNESTTVASTRSQVTPNHQFKKVKDKAIFLCLILGCGIFVMVSFMPARHSMRHESEQEEINTPNATLSQNLQLIAHMKEQTAALQRGLNLPVKRDNHPPKLRENIARVPHISQEMSARMNAPLAFTTESGNAGSSEVTPDTGAKSTNATLTANNANANFVNQQDDIVSVSAKRLPHPEFTVPAGELIPATLETAINSELPGMARAITTRDVYSLEGGNLLIPKGATLVGQFNANVVQGQSRLLVVWNRVQMSNGVTVTLNSPGTDTLGRAGQGADVVNRHFLERFGSGALLSMLGTFAATNGVNGQDEFNSRSQYRMQIANSFQQGGVQMLEQDMMIKPTMQINQGTRINVFVAHDLDFSGVGSAKQSVTPSIFAKRGVWKR